ncbi:MAG TPA: protein-methionine-sulfoxide reductase heme-binding subunit MsrQ [Polyangiales bacterium]|nr:protein-methionine-sulfoxide reductase heme-binding subunit MsrQ [Polyangiales bacterium]
MTAAAQTRVRPFKPYGWLKPGVFTGCLIPLALLIFEAANKTLGADPVAIALNRLGLLALITLLASLSATPLRLLFGWSWPLRLRRMLGLFAFFYASLHFLVYAGVDQGFAWSAIVTDIAKRPFITVGFGALLILIPLAATSPMRIRRLLGPLRWQRLHRLVYLAGILASVHFIWRVKRDLSQPLMYAAVLALLLFVRLKPKVPKG